MSSLDLDVDRVCDDVTSDSRLFHVPAAATGTLAVALSYDESIIDIIIIIIIIIIMTKPVGARKLKKETPAVGVYLVAVNVLRNETAFPC